MLLLLEFAEHTLTIDLFKMCRKMHHEEKSFLVFYCMKLRKGILNDCSQGVCIFLLQSLKMHTVEREKKYLQQCIRFRRKFSSH